VPGPESEGEFKPYLRAVNAIPLLTSEEETRLREQLASQDQTANAAARKRLIESQLRLVISMARRHRGSGLSVLSLVDAGNEGLVRAVERFDPTSRYGFSSWATWWIRQSITRAMAEHGGGASEESDESR
jgi:RNA polymerase primary sigma factor